MTSAGEFPVLRRPTPDDIPEMLAADGRAFGYHMTEADVELIRPQLELDRYLLACDPADGRLIGVTGSREFLLTMPGGAVLTAAGVTSVSVALTHRRRGVLRALMTRQHGDLARDRYPVALLTATEGAIYGRFGYRPATTRRTVSIDRRFARFRAGAPDPGGVREAGTDEVRTLAPALHDRWRVATPGALSRRPAWWERFLRDDQWNRRGGSALFHLLHPDGWAAYRTRDGEVDVVELVAVTTGAHAALWRVLLSLDLFDTVTTRHCPADDPLPFLLTDPRLVRTTGLRDGMWARPLDVAAALSARTWGTEIDLVLEVDDAFLGRGGRFRLRGGSDGADCTPTTATPDLRADVGALGALLLGGHRLGTLARAGLVTGDPAVLRRVDVAAVAEREPQHGTEF